MKVLSPRAHAPFDYVIVAIFALAPSLLGFGGIPAILCYTVAIAVLAVSLLTAYPLGAAKLIPFPVHGFIELVMAPLLVAAPWLFGFDELDRAQWFFVGSGLALGLLYAITDYRAAELDPRQRHGVTPHDAPERRPL